MVEGKKTFKIANTQYIKIRRKLDEIAFELNNGLQKGESLLNPLIVRIALTEIINNKFNTFNDARFELIHVEEVFINSEYCASPTIEDLTNNYFKWLDSSITEEFLKSTTNQFHIGKNYFIKIFKIIEEVSLEDCIKFLKTDDGIIIGKSTIPLLNYAPELCCNNHRILIFEEEKNLIIDSCNHPQLLSVFKYSSGNFKGCFSLHLDSYNDSFKGLYLFHIKEIV